MVIHTVHRETVNSNILLQSEKRLDPISTNVPLAFQQVIYVYFFGKSSDCYCRGREQFYFYVILLFCIDEHIII